MSIRSNCERKKDISVKVVVAIGFLNYPRVHGQHWHTLLYLCNKFSQIIIVEYPDLLSTDDYEDFRDYSM